MAIPLRQSTARTVLIGPFIDESDFVSPLTSLTISASDVRLSKNGANIASKNSTGATHDELGMYACAFTATDTNTVGTLQLVVHESGALPVWHDYVVLEEAVYDALYASGASLDVNLQTATQAQIDAIEAAGQAVEFTVSTTNLSLTTCSSDLSATYTVDGTFKNRMILWTSGTYEGSVSFIEAYDGSNGDLTFSEALGTPANNDTGLIF